MARGVAINKGTVGANVENLDGCSAILCNGVAVAPSVGVLGVVLGQTYLLKKVKDAEALGINAAYDTANSVRVYRHITEFYRMAGEGTKLYICIGAQTKTPTQLITDYAHLMVAFAKGDIAYFGVAYNPVNATYTPTYVDGLEADIRSVIPTAQELHDWSWDTDRPLNVFIEARGIKRPAVSMLDLKGIIVSTVLQYYNNVTLCCGQDWDYAETLTGNAQKYADLGTLLGTKASIQVNQNIGEVETLDISDSKKLVWVQAGLSDHTKIVDDETELDTLDEKGYVFGISYTGIAGYRWNDDHVCAAEVIDENENMNVNTIAHGATLNKAARKLRQKLLPKVKTTVPVDPATGKLPTGMVKYYEGIGNTAFAEMSGEISSGETIVDPASDLMSGDKTLLVSFNVVPTGCIGSITGTINLKKSN